MMRYYIIDDDVNIVKILTNLIEENESGEVIEAAPMMEKQPLKKY